jgi:hypothetical protein
MSRAISSVDIPERLRRSTSSSRQTSPLPFKIYTSSTLFTVSYPIYRFLPTTGLYRRRAHSFRRTTSRSGASQSTHVLPYAT